MHQITDSTVYRAISAFKSRNADDDIAELDAEQEHVAAFARSRAPYLTPDMLRFLLVHAAFVGFLYKFVGAKVPVITQEALGRHLTVANEFSSWTRRCGAGRRPKDLEAQYAARRQHYLKETLFSYILERCQPGGRYLGHESALVTFERQTHYCQCLQNILFAVIDAFDEVAAAPPPKEPQFTIDEKGEQGAHELPETEGKANEV